MQCLKILQVNVDDTYSGGVFSFVTNVYTKMPTSVVFDFWAMREIHNSKYIYERGGCIYGKQRNDPFTRLICNAIALKKHLKNSKYDAIHIHSDLSFKLLFFSLAAKNYKGKIIVHSHSSGNAHGHRYLIGILQIIAKWLLTYTATDFLACSQEAADWMYSTNIRVKQKKVKIIKNGIDSSKFYYSDDRREIFRKQFGINPDDIFIGFIGRLSDEKNIDFVVKTFKCAAKLNSRCTFLIIGDGTIDKTEFEFANPNNKYRIQYLRYHSDIGGVMNALDCLILPSKFEGLPLVAIEAQAVDLPLICSNRITKEVNILGNVCFLPIGINDDLLWAKTAINMMSNFRNDRSDEVSEAGYGYDSIAKELLAIYNNLR